MDANAWAAIGACTTAIVTVLALRSQRRALKVQEQSLKVQEQSLKLQEQSIELQGKSLTLQECSQSLHEKDVAIQEKIYLGELLLSLEHRGEYIAVVLQNTGNAELLDVHITTTPALEVPATSPQSGLDVSRSWVVPDVSIKRILPRQILSDCKAFLAKEFAIHFQGEREIVADMTYKRNGETITSKQTIGIDTILRIQHEIKMRGIYRDSKKLNGSIRHHID